MTWNLSSDRSHYSQVGNDMNVWRMEMYLEAFLEEVKKEKAIVPMLSCMLVISSLFVRFRLSAYI
jgi:hypothetical protein